MNKIRKGDGLQPASVHQMLLRPYPTHPEEDAEYASYIPEAIPLQLFQ